MRLRVMVATAWVTVGPGCGLIAGLDKVSAVGGADGPIGTGPTSTVSPPNNEAKESADGSGATVASIEASVDSPGAPSIGCGNTN